MPVTVTCECGHVTELADREQPGDAAVVADQVCPICGRALLSHVPAGKRMFQQLWQSHADTSSSLPTSEPPATKETDELVAFQDAQLAVREACQAGACRATVHRPSVRGPHPQPAAATAICYPAVAY